MKATQLKRPEAGERDFQGSGESYDVEQDQVKEAGSCKEEEMGKGFEDVEAGEQEGDSKDSIKRVRETPIMASKPVGSTVDREGDTYYYGHHFGGGEQGATEDEYLGKRHMPSVNYTSHGNQDSFQPVYDQQMTKKRSLFDTFDSEFVADFPEEDNVEVMMKKVDKNPIALLNEFCTRAKFNIDYLFTIRKTPRRQMFQCAVVIEGKRINKHCEEGESKQEAKTMAAIDAIKVLESNPANKHEMLCLLHRLEKKVNCSDKNKLRGPTSAGLTISDILADEANILAVLNTYAQNSRESLNWRISNDENVCVAEINIGNLSAAASKNNRKSAKLYAAKNLLKIIGSNAFHQERFFYFLRQSSQIGLPTKKLSLGPEQIGLSSIKSHEADEQAQEIAQSVPEKSAERGQSFALKSEARDHLDDFENSIDLKSWFSNLDQQLKPTESQQVEVNQIFAQVGDIVKHLLPGGNVKVLPLGSYLLGCQRRDKLEVDCLLYDQLNPAIEMSLLKIQELFLERKATFKLVNNHYQLYEVADFLTKTRYEERPDCRLLYFVHSLTSITIKFINFVVQDTHSTGLGQSPLTTFSCSLYHVWWLDQQYSREPVSEEVSKLLRIVRGWRDSNKLKFPSEIVDLAIVYSTYNFKELDTVKVLLKFFALINLLLNDHHSLFYDLSEHHSYLIKTVDLQDRLTVMKLGHRAFIQLSNGSPAAFENLVQEKKLEVNQFGETVLIN